MPDESRRLLHLLRRDPCDLRHALGRVLGAKLGVVRKHRTAGHHALLRRDLHVAFESETHDGRAVAARCGVVGDGPTR
jgi:hypothetical protein